MSSQQTTETVASELEAFVRHQFAVADENPHFVRSANLWEEGFVDSTGVVEVIAFLEHRFDITLPDEVLFDPDFTSIEGIADCVVRVLEGRAA